MRDTRNMAGFPLATRRSSMRVGSAARNAATVCRRIWNRAGRALLRSLHDSRKRAAERIFREHHHLINRDACTFGDDGHPESSQLSPPLQPR
jgi:hypothetical protein